MRFAWYGSLIPNFDGRVDGSVPLSSVDEAEEIFSSFPSESARRSTSPQRGRPRTPRLLSSSRPVLPAIPRPRESAPISAKYTSRPLTMTPQPSGLLLMALDPVRAPMERTGKGAAKRWAARVVRSPKGSGVVVSSGLRWEVRELD